ncbi:Protein of unknown function DUF2046 [Trinorchestia longiramus]|nr:Protein of unknown function DUF2046 [Trinorchestia longiramus]
MADSASESDSSSVADVPIMQPPSMPPSPITREQWQKRIDSLQQQNRVLKTELETFKLRVKSLQEENRALRQASVNIQARAEQEEEYISNTLLKKIQTLKKEKESLALNYEQEEECLTNDLSRKLTQLRNEKVELEQTLEQEQEALVNKLMRKIEKLETETQSKQNDLETLRREKIELENTLEQEQEALVNKLWKRMDKLETEKRLLQGKLEQPISNPPSPADFAGGDGDAANNISSHIQHLRNEVTRMRHQLTTTQNQHERSSKLLAQEERITREENKRLQRRLKEEGCALVETLLTQVERREALCRHLSESESSLDLEEEPLRAGDGVSAPIPRHRVSPTPARPLSPGGGSCPGSWNALYNTPVCSRCPSCNAVLPPVLSSSPSSGHPHFVRQSSRGTERFVKPSPPPPSSPLSSLLQQQQQQESESSLDLEEEPLRAGDGVSAPIPRHRVSPTPARPLSPGGGSCPGSWNALYNTPVCSRCPSCNAVLPPVLSSSPSSGHPHFVRQSSRGTERFVKPSPPPPSSPLSSLLQQQQQQQGPYSSGSHPSGPSSRVPVDLHLSSSAASVGAGNDASGGLRTSCKQRPPTPETMSLDHPPAPPSPMDISRN